MVKNMKIIKCGGSILKNISERIKLYKYIKSLDEKVVLVVSAFDDCPYSTKELSSLLKNNYSYEMKQQLITLGEIISSIRVCNELLNELIDACVIFKEDIGIYVKTSEKMDSIEKLDNNILLKNVKEHKVVVVPGFIGINQDNHLVSLNENGSDLTALLIAKMLDEKHVLLYKDVLGLSSIDPNLSFNYKLYKKVSYSLMNQIVSHGCNIIQQDALLVAKENDIVIDLVYYLNNLHFTKIEKLSNEKVIVFQINENDIYIDGYNNKEKIENILLSSNVLFDYVLPCNSYIKIVSSYENQNLIINTLHNLYLKGEL